MNRFWISAGVLAVVLVATGSMALAAVPPPVPLHVQEAIKKSHPTFAYVPTALPSGYRYVKWVNGKTGYDIYFGQQPQLPDLGFHVLNASCASFGGAAVTYRLNGVRVAWSGTYEDQQAFRCLGPNLVVEANRSVPGDGATKTAAQKRDALYFVRLVAYARRIAN